MSDELVLPYRLVHAPGCVCGYRPGPDSLQAGWLVVPPYTLSGGRLVIGGDEASRA